MKQLNNLDLNVQPTKALRYQFNTKRNRLDVNDIPEEFLSTFSATFAKRGSGKLFTGWADQPNPFRELAGLAEEWDLHDLHYALTHMLEGRRLIWTRMKENSFSLYLEFRAKNWRVPNGVVRLLIQTGCLEMWGNPRSVNHIVLNPVRAQEFLNWLDSKEVN